VIPLRPAPRFCSKSLRPPSAVSFQFHPCSRVGAGTVSWHIPHPPSNDSTGSPLASKCLNFDSCWMMRSNPALFALVDKYWMTSAASGLMPLTRTLMLALDPPAAARTVSVPPRLVMTGLAFHLLFGVVSLPDFRNVLHATVHCQVWTPVASVSNSMAGQTAAEAMMNAALGFGLMKFILIPRYRTRRRSCTTQDRRPAFDAQPVEPSSHRSATRTAQVSLMLLPR